MSSVENSLTEKDFSFQTYDSTQELIEIFASNFNECTFSFRNCNFLIPFIIQKRNIKANFIFSECHFWAGIDFFGRNIDGNISFSSCFFGKDPSCFEKAGKSSSSFLINFEQSQGKDLIFIKCFMSGAILLDDTVFDGSLVFEDTTILGDNKHSIKAQRLHVLQYVQIYGAAKSNIKTIIDGGVDFTGAKINQGVFFQNIIFSSDYIFSLRLQEGEFQGWVRLKDCIVFGRIIAHRAIFRQGLELSGSRLFLSDNNKYKCLINNANNDILNSSEEAYLKLVDDLVLELSYSEVHKSCYLPEKFVVGHINLSHCHFSRLADDKFTYEIINNNDTDEKMQYKVSCFDANFDNWVVPNNLQSKKDISEYANFRLYWLLSSLKSEQRLFDAELFVSECAQTYIKCKRRDIADEIMVRFRSEYLRSNWHISFRNFFEYLLHIYIKHGRAPGRSLLICICFISLFALSYEALNASFGASAEYPLFVKQDGISEQNAGSINKMLFPSFQYSVDAFIPLIDMQVEKHWTVTDVEPTKIKDKIKKLAASYLPILERLLGSILVAITVFSSIGTLVRQERRL